LRQQAKSCFATDEEFFEFLEITPEDLREMHQCVAGEAKAEHQTNTSTSLHKEDRSKDTQVQNDFFGDADLSRSQVLFTIDCAKRLAAALHVFRDYNRICCLCSPTIAYAWSKLPAAAGILLLEIDEKRFGKIPGYRQFDIFKPVSSLANLAATDTPVEAIVADFPVFSHRKAAILLHGIVHLLRNGHPQPDLFIVWARRMNLPCQEYLFEAFYDQLHVSQFELEHDNINPCFQDNFLLYTNVDFPRV
jgi:putative N6-adenine methyltransferase